VILPFVADMPRAFFIKRSFPSCIEKLDVGPMLTALTAEQHNDVHVEEDIPTQRKNKFNIWNMKINI
jgi:hypothetical protein